ncbi:TetR/AcrR family transcriptional regulator [Motilibacter sp. K478]|nr:TetR/AcrR family transcriptional regulator [Motilibacter aurantiacus]
MLGAARKRFARHGYAATTVREIADDAGANVALISRYFGSKEGLFEACLTAAGDEMAESEREAFDLSQLAGSVARRMVDVPANGGLLEALLLSVRSSGDEQAEQVRARTLRTYGEKIAALAAGDGGVPPDDVELRAQFVLALSLGLAVLRAAPEAGPLATATEQELVSPLHDVVTALLRPTPRS